MDSPPSQPVYSRRKKWILVLKSAIVGGILGTPIALLFQEEMTNTSETVLAIIGCATFGVLLGALFGFILARIILGPDPEVVRLMQEYKAQKQYESELIKDSLRLSTDNIPRYVALIALVVVMFLAIYTRVVLEWSIPSAVIFGLGSLFAFLIFRRPR